MGAAPPVGEADQVVGHETRTCDEPRIETEPSSGSLVCVILIEADALLPFELAVIVAVPTVIPVTTPFWLTCATEALLDDQVTVPRCSGRVSDRNYAATCNRSS